jgi:hypothetical protein
VCSTSGGSSSDVPVIVDDSVHVAPRSNRLGAHLLRQFGRHGRRTGGRKPQRRQVGIAHLRQFEQLGPASTPWPAVTCSRTITSSIPRQSTARQNARDHPGELSHTLFMYPACANGAGIERTSNAARIRSSRPTLAARWSNHALRRASCHSSRRYTRDLG